MSGDTSVTAFPEGDNLFSWIGTITGSEGTVYEGLKFNLSLKFPSGNGTSHATLWHSLVVPVPIVGRASSQRAALDPDPPGKWWSSQP